MAVFSNHLRAVKAASSDVEPVSQTGVRNDMSKCSGTEKDNNNGAGSSSVADSSR